MKPQNIRRTKDPLLTRSKSKKQMAKAVVSLNAPISSRVCSTMAAHGCVFQCWSHYRTEALVWSVLGTKQRHTPQTVLPGELLGYKQWETRTWQPFYFLSHMFFIYFLWGRLRVLKPWHAHRGQRTTWGISYSLLPGGPQGLVAAALTHWAILSACKSILKCKSKFKKKIKDFVCSLRTQ